MSHEEPAVIATALSMLDSMANTIGSYSYMAYDRYCAVPASQDMMSSQRGSSTEQIQSNGDLDCILERICDPVIVERFKEIRSSMSTEVAMGSSPISLHTSKSISQSRPAAVGPGPLASEASSSRISSSEKQNLREMQDSVLLNELLGREGNFSERFELSSRAPKTGPSSSSSSAVPDAKNLKLRRHPGVATLQTLITEASTSQVGSSNTLNINTLVRRQPVPTNDPLASPSTETPVTEDSEWTKHNPPRELLRVDSETAISFEIESILEASIEAVQNRLVQELALRDKEQFARESSNTSGGCGRASSDSGLETWVRYWRDDGKGNSNAEEKTPAVSSNERERQPYNSQPPINAYSSAEGDWRPDHAKHLSTATSSKDSGYISSPVENDPLKSRGSIFRKFFQRTTKGKGKAKAAGINSGESCSDFQSIDRGGIKECVSCLEDFEAKDVVPLSCHSYCFACFHELISNSITSETYWPPKCCLNEVPIESILANIKPQLRTRYQKAVEERAVPVNERVYCYKQNCGVFIPPRNINKATACGACPQCRTKICTTCYAAFHNTSECPSDIALQATLQLATDFGWKRCIGCQAVVEHNEGCLHMTCKCKSEFCYICGAKWRTCACTDGDLATLLASAASRRAQTATREAQTERERIASQRAERQAQRARDEEAEELQQILDEIEVYEAEERATMESEEESLRRNVIAAREERLEKRVREISKHFYNLKNELEMLHDVQRVAMQERWAREDEDAQRSLDRERQSARVAAAALRVNAPSRRMAEMRTKHATERQLVEWEVQEKIQSSQSAVDDKMRDEHFAATERGWLKELNLGSPPDSMDDVQLEVIKRMLRKRWLDSEEKKDWEKETSELIWKHSQSVREGERRLREVKEKHMQESRALETKEDNEEADRILHDEEERLNGVAMDRRCDEKWLQEVAIVRRGMLHAMEVQEVVTE